MQQRILKKRWQLKGLTPMPKSFKKCYCLFYRWIVLKEGPHWATASLNRADAKAKAKGKAPKCQPKAMPKGKTAAEAASAQPEAEKKEPQDAAVNEELPSPNGKGSHAKQDTTVKKRKKKRSTTKTPERRRKRSRTPERKRKKSHRDNDEWKKDKKAEGK